MLVKTDLKDLLELDASAVAEALRTQRSVSETNWEVATRVAENGQHSPLRALLDLGLIGEDDLASTLADHLACPHWTPEGETREDHPGVPAAFMRSAGVLVFAPAADAEDSGDDRPTIVCADPTDVPRLSSLASMLGTRCGIEIGTFKDIEAYAEGNVARDEAAAAIESDAIDVSSEVDQLRDMASEAPVIRFFNQTVEQAVDAGASDIHIERFDRNCSLRYRVDGLLNDRPAPPLRMLAPLLCRIKIMAGLDIAEQRRAQDGRIQMRLRGRMVDLRVSLLPTLYGQDAVLRIQDRAKLGSITLDDLGFEPEQTGAIREAVKKTSGIVLVTGPTGSGKTTTLYATLRGLVATERKIVTVEDPVEYAIDGVNQVGVNNAVNRTFSNTMRHILRHDPDVILVGEIRDRETAQMAFEAALTGHMVLSTLHTNDVPSTYTRLLDIGVEPFLINATVECVTAQRLFRTICPDCRNEPQARQNCKTCLGTGYRGRTAIMEHALTTHAVKRAIRDQADDLRISEVLRESGFRSMREIAMTLVERGVTDEAEVVRVLGPAPHHPHP